MGRWVTDKGLKEQRDKSRKDVVCAVIFSAGCTYLFGNYNKIVHRIRLNNNKQVVNDLKSDVLVVDTNIFVHEKFPKIIDKFSDFLKNYKLKILLLKHVHMELNKLRKHKVKDKASLARNSFRCIEKFTNENILTFEDKYWWDNKTIYADPVIKNYIYKAINNDQKVCLLSDDIELRTKIWDRAHKFKKSDLLRIHGIDALEKLFYAENQLIVKGGVKK